MLVVSSQFFVWPFIHIRDKGCFIDFKSLLTSKNKAFKMFKLEAKSSCCSFHKHNEIPHRFMYSSIEGIHSRATSCATGCCIWNLITGCWPVVHFIISIGKKSDLLAVIMFHQIIRYAWHAKKNDGMALLHIYCTVSHTLKLIVGCNSDNDRLSKCVSLDS